MSADDDEEYYYSDEGGAFEDEDGEDLGSPVKSPGGGSAAHPSSPAKQRKTHRTAHGPNVSSFAHPAGADDYRLLSPLEIDREQKKIVNEVASILDIPPECASTLLIFFKWSREKLFDAYTNDPDTTRAKAGIVHLGVSSHPPPPSFDCLMCLDTVPSSNGFGLGCKHCFCRSCWSGYLTAAVAEGGQDCIYTKCPAHADGCCEAVTMTTVDRMAPREVAEKWRRYEQQAFVNISKNMAWCPNPSGCPNAFVATGPVKTAACGCGFKFCFACSREAHDPASCSQVNAWSAKCGSDSETASWLASNTKQCPLCGVRIEKNQGCNHMQCKNSACRHEWCWVCTGPWTEHGQSTGGYYKCNKFKAKKDGSAAGAGGASSSAASGVSASAKAAQEMERFVFYYQRYANHDAARKFAQKHRQAAARRMTELQEAGGLSYSDVTFLDDATEALLECRKALKYTYVLAFYMSEESPDRGLFEHLQEQLERSTEHLAELTEKPVDKMDRVEVVNFTRVTLQFLRNLIAGLEDGLTTVM